MTLGYLPVCAAILGAVSIYAAAPKGVTPGSIATYTATSANVSGAPDAIRIEILRWSSDAERDRIMDAWNGRSANAGGRGGARASTGRGGGGRGGRGGGEEAAVAAPPPAPDAMLAKALREATTVGYVWSREIAGYAIRYAGKIENADGSERIVLLTDRRLGAVNVLWNTAGGEPSHYDFSVIELRLKANGGGEGKASLTGTVAPDSAAKMVALENYDSLPVVFTNVQKHTGTQH